MRAGSILAAVLITAAFTGPALAGEDDEPRFGGKTARQWARALGDEDFTTSYEAKRALEKGAGAAVPVLIAVLACRDDEAVVAAAETIEEIGPAARGAAMALRALLDRDDRDVKLAAAAALVAIEAAPDDLVDRLLRDFRKASPYGKVRIAEVLGKMGPRAAVATPELVALFEASELWNRVQVAAALARIGRHLDQVLPVLADNLWMDRSIPNTDVVDALIALGERGAAAAGIYLNQLDSVDRNERLAAAVILVATGRESELALARLLEDERGRLSVWLSLSRSAPARAAVLRALKSSDSGLRSRAESVAHLFRAEGAELTELLAPAGGAKRTGPMAALAGALAPDHSLRVAVTSVERMGPEKAVPHLVKALRDERAKVRERSARLLATFGPDSAPALDALVERLADEEPAVRRAALTAIAATGKAAARVWVEVAACTADEDRAVRAAARVALRKLKAAQKK